MSDTPDVAEQGRMTDDSPAANQSKTEPMPPSSAHGASDTPTPPVAESDAPGDAAGVAVPSVLAAGGTSEEAPRVAHAQPGKPDGEVAT
jgi:hypothetical protein